VSASLSCGFVENGWENALRGIDEELARDPDFGRELLDRFDEEEPPPRGMWGKLRDWLTLRRDPRDLYDRLAPRDALY